jgi:hypothetical protein
MRDYRIKTVELLIKNQSGEKSFTIKKEYLFPDPDKPEAKRMIFNVK